MLTKGIFKRILVGKDDGPTVDILVARVVFRSNKCSELFADCASKVCDYEREHGNLFCARYVVGDAAGYDSDLTAPINMHITDNFALGLIKGSVLIEYSSSYVDDVTTILALVSSVESLSVYDARRNLDDIVCDVCSGYEGIYGHGC